MLAGDKYDDGEIRRLSSVKRGNGNLVDGGVEKQGDDGTVGQHQVKMEV
jgi:hypothetical protein